MNSTPVGPGLLFFTLVLTAGAEERPKAQLVYVREAGSERCPDAEALRDAVAARLGYQPFDEGAPIRMTVSVTATERGLEGRVVVQGQGERVLASANRDCRELAQAMALTLSIAIDPLSLTRAPTPPPVDPRPETVPEQPTKPPQPAGPARQQEKPAEAPSAAHVSLSAGGLASVASAPSVAGGVTLGARAKWVAFSIGGEARVDFPATGRSALGGFETSLVTASVLPCFHRGLFGLCGVATGGVLRASGVGLVEPQRAALPYFGLGVRLQGELELGASFFGRLVLEAIAPMAYASLVIGQTEVWATPPVTGSFGIAVGFTF